MRFNVFMSIGLVANVAVASVCKPRSRTLSGSSSVSTELVSTASTASATFPTTSAGIEVKTTTSVELSISATSATYVETTAETESGTVSSGLSASTATETTATAIFTTTAVTTTTAGTATSAETTTTHITTTTEDVFVPIPTFDLKALGSDVNGQFVRGDAIRYAFIGWFSTEPPVLTFSIEANTNFAREVGGKYLCIAWGDGYYPSSLMLCDMGQFTGVTPIPCEQTRDRKLKCSAPAGQCIMNEQTMDDDCSGLPGTLDQFYMYRGPMINTPFLAMASSGNPPTSNDYQALDIQLVPYGE